MKRTTKGMTTTKIPLISLMATTYLTNHQKQQLMHYLCKNLPWTWISKVCIRIKAIVSVLWHWNAANAAIMLLPKDVSSKMFL